MLNKRFLAVAVSLFAGVAVASQTPSAEETAAKTAFNAVVAKIAGATDYASALAVAKEMADLSHLKVDAKAYWTAEADFLGKVVAGTIKADAVNAERAKVAVLKDKEFGKAFADEASTFEFHPSVGFMTKVGNAIDYLPAKIAGHKLGRNVFFYGVVSAATFAVFGEQIKALIGLGDDAMDEEEVSAA